MNQQSPITAETPTPTGKPAGHSVPFGVNEMRLTARQWLATAAILAIVLPATPRLWKKIERFPTGPDYRIPYSLSKDYWLYQRRVEQLQDHSQIVVLGDSVIWGEYVRPAGTLTHFLNERSGQPDRFVNCGVNGMFPLAMEGLVRDYGGSLRNRKIILHCNVLWMTSPKADLSTTREETFNHARLVPQFTPRIRCYRADASERLSAIVEHHVGFSAWAGHLQSAYFNERSVPRWTLEDDGGSPPRLPNAYRNPFGQILLSVPAEPGEDPDRGPGSPRHKPWKEGGAQPARFEWVGLANSLQWGAFQRTVSLLRDRGNEVLVVVGPFNEHMVAEDQRPTYRAIRDGIAEWLQRNEIAHVVPAALPSELYADASHPLTEGYALLAETLLKEPVVRVWLSTGTSPIDGRQR